MGSQRFYPYGRTRSDVGSGTIATDKGFTGHQREGALYYMRARFYEQGLGRFAQGDSIVPDAGNPQALNRYAYVLNNPMAYVDPTGRCGYNANNAALNNLLGMCGPGTTNTYNSHVLAPALRAIRAMLNANCRFYSGGGYSCPRAGGRGNAQSAAERQRMRRNELRAAGMRAAQAYIDATPRATPARPAEHRPFTEPRSRGPGLPPEPPHPSTEEVMATFAWCQQRGGCASQAFGSALLDVLRSDCAQGIGRIVLAGGITLAAVETGGALIVGGYLATGTVTSAAFSGGVVVYVSTGGDPLSVAYGVGNYLYTGLSQARSCIP